MNVTSLVGDLHQIEAGDLRIHAWGGMPSPFQAHGVNLHISWEEICTLRGRCGVPLFQKSVPPLGFPRYFVLVRERDRAFHGMSEIPPMKCANLHD